jgi:hypothetical protein
VRAAARAHWRFLLLVAVGAVLRVVTFFAYQPALIYQDSQGYLENAAQLVPFPRWPIGYPVFLRILPLSGGLEVVPLVQHLLALATLTRVVALLVIVPAAVTVIAAGARPSRPVAVAVLVAAFAVPLGCYAAWFHSEHGQYALLGPTGRFLYGRVAAFVDCTEVAPPAAERPLCPDEPVGERPSSQDFTWSATSPIYRVPEADRERLADSFAKRAIRAQPLDYAGTVVTDVAHAFAIKRSVPRRIVPFEDVWTFQPEFPRREQADPVIRRCGGDGGSTQPDLVAFLRGYQRVAFTPGPLFAAGLLVGFLAAAGLGRARHSPLRGAAFLFASLGLVLGLMPAMTQQLMPRYTLPWLVLLMPALAIGITALRGR